MLIQLSQCKFNITYALRILQGKRPTLGSRTATLCTSCVNLAPVSKKWICSMNRRFPLSKCASCVPFCKFTLLILAVLFHFACLEGDQLHVVTVCFSILTMPVEYYSSVACSPYFVLVQITEWRTERSGHCRTLTRTGRHS